MLGEMVSKGEKELRNMLDVWKSSYQHSIALKNTTETLIEFTVTFWMARNDSPTPTNRVNVFFIVFVTQNPITFSFQLEGEQFVYHIPGSHAYERNIDDMISDSISFKERLRDAFMPQIAGTAFVSDRINSIYKSNQQALQQIPVDENDRRGRFHLEDSEADHQPVDERDLELYVEIEKCMQELKNISSSDSSNTVSFKDFFTSFQMLGIALHDDELEILFRRFKAGNYIQFSEFSSKALQILQDFLGRENGGITTQERGNFEHLKAWAAQHDLTPKQLRKMVLSIFFQTHTDVADEWESRSNVLDMTQLRTSLKSFGNLGMSKRELDNLLYLLEHNSAGTVVYLQFSMCFNTMLHQIFTRQKTQAQIENTLLEHFSVTDVNHIGRLKLHHIRDVLLNFESVPLSEAQAWRLLSNTLTNDEDEVNYVEFASQASLCILKMFEPNMLKNRAKILQTIHESGSEESNALDIDALLSEFKSMPEKDRTALQLRLYLKEKLENPKLKVLLAVLDEPDNAVVDIEPFLNAARNVLRYLDTEYQIEMHPLNQEASSQL